MNIYILRHGMTAGNREKRYIGVTDEPLCPEGREALAALGTSRHGGNVYVSPLIRCLETAKMVLPGAVLVPVLGLKEMDFGLFEAKNWQEMADFGPYREWVDGGCEGRCPGGESRAAFEARVSEAFLDIVSGRFGPAIPGENRCDGAGEAGSEGAEMGAKRDKTVVMVAHGGTIMALFDRFSRPHGDYWTWKSAPAEGYAARWDGEGLADIRRLTGLQWVRELDAAQ